MIESGEKMQVFTITKDYITLGQLLKEIAEIGSGGQAKWYLQEMTVLVDNEIERRRGRKLYPGMTVTLESGEQYQIVEQD